MPARARRCPELDALSQRRVLVILDLLAVDGGMPCDEDQFIVGRQAHALVGGEQRALHDLLVGVDVLQHHGQPVAAVLPLGVTDSSLTGHLGEQLGRLDLVRGVGHADVAVADDGLILAVGGKELAQVLHDEQRLEAVARDEGQRLLEDVEFAQAGEFVEQQQEFVRVAALARPADVEVHAFGQPPHHLIDDQTQQGLEAVLVAGGHHKIQRRLPGFGLAVHVGAAHDAFQGEVGDAGVVGDDGIAVEREKGQRGGQHARGFVRRLVQKGLAGLRHGGPAGAGVRVGALRAFFQGDIADIGHHGLRAFHRLSVFGLVALGCFFGDLADRAAVREDGLHGVQAAQAGVRAFAVPIEQDEQHHPGHEIEAGLGPVVVQSLAVGIDDHGGDVLHVLDQVAVHADFLQGVESGGVGGCRVELDGAMPQHLLAKAAGQRPVLTFDVVHQDGLIPVQQGGDDDAHPLAGSGGREHHHVFRPFVPQVAHLLAVVPGAKQHPALVFVVGQDGRCSHFGGGGPMGRSMQIVALGVGLA